MSKDKKFNILNLNNEDILNIMDMSNFEEDVKFETHRINYLSLRLRKVNYLLKILKLSDSIMSMDDKDIKNII